MGSMAGFMSWQLSIDHGGTCTDIVARNGADRIIAKTLSTKIASRRTVAPFGLDGIPGGGFGHS
jgi:N-methylhydantoinase A/oxoprolinase/acetone carboxylase beta subunit